MTAILKESWTSGVHVEKQGDLLGCRFKYEMKSCSFTGFSYLLEGYREEACPVRRAVGFKTAANCFKVHAAQKQTVDFYSIF